MHMTLLLRKPWTAVKLLPARYWTAALIALAQALKHSQIRASSQKEHHSQSNWRR